ncbi:MAG: helix-turn-helix domain-containing protein [Gemmatimonadales bacterium]
MTTVAVAAGRKLSILIGSERESLTRALAESLRAQGHDTVIQETASGVSDALGTPGVDAVIIDPDLPQLDFDRLRAAFTTDRPAVPEPIDSVERRHIAATLRFTGGNRRNAAQLLGIARSTLLAKIRKYGLDRA